jgi:uncharacterized protein YkwD
MNSYETSATVEEQGQVRVVGVPFEPGTEVEVTIKPARKGENTDVATATDRATRLFAALNKGRNTEPVGPLRREDLYDRQVVR